MKNKQKRLWLIIATIVVALFCAVFFVACGSSTPDSSDGDRPGISTGDKDNPNGGGNDNPNGGNDSPNGGSDNPNGGGNDNPNGGNGENQDNHTAHKYSATKTVDPTCIEKGYTIYTCTCGDSYNDDYVDATGEHIYTKYEYNNDATCVADGSETAKCDYCNETHTRIKANSITDNHNYSDYVCTNCYSIDKNAPETEGLHYNNIVVNREIVGYIVYKGSANINKYVKIPQMYKDKPVKSIGEMGFKGCSSLTSIEIPHSITSIGDSAFYGCSSLKSIKISNSVTSIGGSAFFACSSLTSLEIPYTVKSIGRGAFENCKSLTIYCETTPDLSWDKNWNSSDCPVVRNCASNSIAGDGYEYAIIDGLRYGLKDGVATIVGQPTNLSGNITMPAMVKYKNTDYSVSSIDEDAFSGCSKIEKITVDSNNANYSSQDGIMYNKSKTEFVYIPKAINGAITIPDSVTSIGDQAFSGCSGVTSIEIPNSVTSIGYRAFYYCRGATSIEIPNSVTSIGNSAFQYCSSLISIEIPNSVTSIENSTFEYCSSLTSIEIPSSVTSIGSSAFGSCSSLTSIEIPNSVTSIGNGAFEYCSNLTIYCEASSKLSGWHNNWNNSNRPVVWNCKSNDKDDSGYAYAVIDGIRYRLRYGNADVIWLSWTLSGNITIPSSVTYKDDTYSVTSIDDSTFSSCNSLTSITIPNSVTSIGKNAFSFCSSLTIYCEATSKPSGWNRDWAPDYCPVVWNCKNNDKDDSGYAYAVIDGIRYRLKDGNAEVIAQPWDLSGDITMPSSVTYKDDTYSVTSIGDSAFSNCYSLTSIIIPNSVMSVGNSAFYNCLGLTSVTIPNSVTSIGYGTFSDCIGLTSIKFSGTQEQWGAITKGGDWNNNTGNYTITFSDGTMLSKADAS